MRIEKKEIRSILVVDDDRDDYELVEEAMRIVDPAVNVDFLTKCEDAKKYSWNQVDLLLLDINMPHDDGFAWLKGLRDNGYEKLPIVMYTNSLSPTHIAKAYNEGANLYFSKPESFPSLVKGLKELLQMDWSDPIEITKEYVAQGKYKVFQR
jgi:CheY-like chemotaxis protein